MNNLQILESPITAPPRPIMNRVLIEPMDDDMSDGGLVLPTTRKVEMNKGIVRGLGSGRRMDGTIQPFEVEIGQKVMFKLGAAQITIAGVQYFLVQEEDIIAVL